MGTKQNGRVLRTTESEVVLDDRKRDDLPTMDQGSISYATRRKAFQEAMRSNVQARSEPAHKLTRGNKREITALDKKTRCAVVPSQQI